MSDSSSTIGAILFAIESLVRQVDWRVEPAAETEEAVEWAAFVEECIQDLDDTFEDFMSEILSCLIYGWSYFETVYKLRKGLTNNPQTRSRYNDGRIGWRLFALRPQDTLDHWEFDEDGKLLGMHQWDQYTGKKAFIPIEKALLFRTKTTKNNPEGRSLFRNAVSDYYYHKRICKIEAIGIERDMTGIIKMEVPLSILRRDADANQKALLADLSKMLGELKRDEREYAIVPAKTTPEGKSTGYDLTLLQSGGRRQIDTNAIKTSYKVGMLQSVLAQFIELGMQGVGSFALASSQTDLFAVALGSFLDNFAATINRKGIDKLMQFNGVDPELWPELVHGDLEDVPLQEFGAYITALATAGQLPEDDAIKRKCLEVGGLPMPVNDEETPTFKRVRKNRGGFKAKFSRAD